MTATAIATELKLTVTREALRAAVDAVAGVIKRNPTLPVLATFQLTTEEGRLSIAATDFDHWVTRTVPADVAEPGVVLVNSESFGRLVKELPPAVVQLSATTKNRLGIRCGDVRSTLAGMAPDEFPSMSTDMSEGLATGGRLKVAELRALAERTTFAVASQGETGVHEAIVGVLCEMRADSLRLVACNRYKFAIADAPVAMGTDVGDVVVPTTALEHAFRCFADEDEVEIARGEYGLTFRSDSGLVATRLIDAKYPAYKAIIRKAHDHSAIVDRTPLLSSLRRALAVAREHMYGKVKLSFEADSVAIAAQIADAGDVDDKAPCRFDGAPVAVNVNASSLAEILRHMPTEEVRLEMSGPDQGLTIRPHEWNGPGEYVCVLAGIRDV